MSHNYLTRKWRPHTFDELMVGQEHVLRMLINALDNQQLHHAYLFTGTRGVGKTTLARLLAKCLNCETGVTSKPCGTCNVCQSIDAGQFLDLIDAWRTKAENIRELLENVQYAPAPTQGRYKIYVIDEVDMLTAHTFNERLRAYSFNALLKALEPPAHVKFLLATKYPKKLPITILSRCLQFNLKRVPTEKIVAQLAHTCAAENIEFQHAALDLLASVAEGSMLDALNMLHQVILRCYKYITAQRVRDILDMGMR